MKVSLNELTAAVKRALEGLGYSLGDYEDAADILIWMEMHGLQGLRELSRGLPYLCKEECTPAGITYEDGNVAVVDTHGNGGLAYVELATGLAYSNALKSGFSYVRMDHCHNRKMIIKSMVNYARRGMNCLAFWRNGSDPMVEYVVSIAAYAQYPDYLEYSASQLEKLDDKHSVSILCSQNFQMLQAFASGVLSEDKASVTTISSEQMAANHSQALEQGIEIEPELWEELNSLTERILVESTDASRAGAGA
ncbi:MAG: DUF3726 domain-containing protein [Pseudomonadales bacterium]